VCGSQCGRDGDRGEETVQPQRRRSFSLGTAAVWAKSGRGRWHDPEISGNADGLELPARGVLNNRSLVLWVKKELGLEHVYRVGIQLNNALASSSMRAAFVRRDRINLIDDHERVVATILPGDTNETLFSTKVGRSHLACADRVIGHQPDSEPLSCGSRDATMRCAGWVVPIGRPNSADR
jgi:hypothetical protein